MPRKSRSIRIKYLLVSLATVVALVLYASTYSEPVLRVSVIPDESPSVLRRKLKPLTVYLEKKIGMKIEFRPAADGDALVGALISNKLDMVWLDGFDFNRAKARSNDQVIPLVQRAEDEQTRSVFITTHAGITKLEDLKGKTFSFGARSSVSGHLMPRSYMHAAYIDPDTDLKRIDFSGADEATVAAVAGGKADAGVLSRASWERLIQRGKVEPKVVYVFYTTPGYHNYSWTVGAEMDVNLRLKLTDAFLALDRNNAQDKEILDLQRASKYIPVRAEYFSVIEEAARRAGLFNEK